MIDSINLKLMYICIIFSLEMVFYLSINMTSDLKLYYLNDGFDNFNVKIVKYDNEESDIMTYFNNNKSII